MPQSTSSVRVRYAETDTMGVVYHANYFVWFEIGRTDLLRTLGWSYREMEEAGFRLPVIEAHCEYRLPARYDDEIEIHTRGLLVSRVRLEFHYQARRSSPASELVAAGFTRHASINLSGRPCRLPERIRNAFA